MLRNILMPRTAHRTTEYTGKKRLHILPVKMSSVTYKKMLSYKKELESDCSVEAVFP